MSTQKLLTPEELSQLLGGQPSARTLKDWATAGKISHVGGRIPELGIKMPIRFTYEHYEELINMFMKDVSDVQTETAEEAVTRIDAKRRISAAYAS